MSAVREPLGWLSIVVYEGVPRVVPFTDEAKARAFHADASENWSEHYLCAIVDRGPKGEPLDAFGGG